MSRKHLMIISAAACALSLVGVLIDELDRNADAPYLRIARSLPAVWAVALASYGESSDSQHRFTEQETIRKSFAFNAAGGARRLEVDNVFGSIEVVSTKADQVELVVAKAIRAESQERLEAARSAVKLDISQTGNDVRLYVDGPFRCHCSGDCVGVRDDEGYRVRMDFQLQVPSNIDLKLSTVNEGKIKVQGVGGDFSLRNVNGEIEMSEVAGSGSARTVNGGVKVTFRENPRANSEFASLNGSVELQFAKNLAADFRFKTLNGGIYTDYSLNALPQRPPVQERRNGKLVFRTDRYTGGRVGSGGPEIKLENLNGDIRVLERRS